MLAPIQKYFPKVKQKLEPSEDSLRKARARLLGHAGALSYVKETLGLDDKTIEEYNFGLSAPYADQKSGAVKWQDYLMAPVVEVSGLFTKTNVFFAIPGVTLDHVHEAPRPVWCKGETRSYYSWGKKEQQRLFICEDIRSLWALSQLLRGSDLERELVLVASSHGRGAPPAAWSSNGSEFWKSWEGIYAGHNHDLPDKLTGKRLGDEYARALATQACRELRRVTPPGIRVRDWTDWVREGGTIDQFRELLVRAEAVRVVTGTILDEDDGESPGEFGWNPIHIEGAYHKGHLYEVIKTKIRVFDEDTGLLSHEPTTTVVRSDGQRFRPMLQHARAGVSERVLTLQDGTHLARWPEVNDDSTWTWPSIKGWIAACERGEKPLGLPVSTLFRAVLGHLKASVWLPFQDDYALLAAGAMVSYCQAAFDAVPMFLVTGPFGSGKSEVGIAMAKLGANCPGPLGAISAATLWRHTHRRRGLTVIDDLEAIGSSPGDTPDAMRQTLLVSYKKETATKVLTENASGGRKVEMKLSTYGVKVISNTSGTDPVLASRMFIVETRRQPVGLERDKSGELDPAQLVELRNQLHVWAFSNVSAIREEYTANHPNQSSRAEEIAVPLRVIAALSKDEAIGQSLERAITRQRAVPVDPDSPEELMRQALTQIIRRSVEQTGAYQTYVTVTQLIWEMGLLVDRNFGQNYTTEIPVLSKPEVVGRMLKQVFSDYAAPQERTKFLGKGLRAYKLSPEFVSTTLTSIRQQSPDLFATVPTAEPNYRAFCIACASCPYQTRCDMQAERRKRDPEGARVTAH